MLVGLLGIPRGGAYLPLDPTYPQERLSFMLEEAQASIKYSPSYFSQLADNGSHFYSFLFFWSWDASIGCLPVCLDDDWETIAQQVSRAVAASKRTT